MLKQRAYYTKSRSDACSHGKKVICYFSAGSHENWRDDVDSVPGSDLGHVLDGWPGEHWWDITCKTERHVWNDTWLMDRYCWGITCNIHIILAGGAFTNIQNWQTILKHRLKVWEPLVAYITCEIDGHCWDITCKKDEIERQIYYYYDYYYHYY